MGDNGRSKGMSWLILVLAVILLGLALSSGKIGGSVKYLYNTAYDIYHREDLRKCDAFLASAVACEQNGDYDGAVAEVNKCIAIFPRNADLYAGRAALYARKGDYDRVKEDCGTAIGLDPGSARAYYYRAVAREQLGEAGPAAEDYTKAKELDPAGRYSQ